MFCFLSPPPHCSPLTAELQGLSSIAGTTWHLTPTTLTPPSLPSPLPPLSLLPCTHYYYTGNLDSPHPSLPPSLPPSRPPSGSGGPRGCPGCRGRDDGGARARAPPGTLTLRHKGSLPDCSLCSPPSFSITFLENMLTCFLSLSQPLPSSLPPSLPVADLGSSRAQLVE